MTKHSVSTLMKTRTPKFDLISSRKRISKFSLRHYYFSVVVISRKEPSIYEASPKFEKQFAEIRDFVSNQAPPKGFIEQADFLEVLFDFLESAFGIKEINQDNFTLSIVDLLRIGRCSINDNLFELDQPYLENENYHLNWQWEDFVDPIIHLSQTGNQYKAFLLLSIYANLPIPYVAADGYDGSDERTKIEYLEYLISINSSDPVKLKKDLEKIHIPLSSLHPDIGGDTIRVDVSQDAVVIYNLKNNLISNLNDLNLQQFMYGIILGKIDKEAANKFTSVRDSFEPVDIYEVLGEIYNLVEEDDYRKNNLIYSDLVKQGFNEVSTFARSQAGETLIEFLLQLTILFTESDSEEQRDCYDLLKVILNYFISLNTDSKIREKYIKYLTEIGGEFNEIAESTELSRNKKKGFFSRFLRQ